MDLPVHVVSLALICWLIPAGWAQEIAERRLPPSLTGEALSELTIRPDDMLPSELRAESAIYLQRRLGEWKEADARHVLGTPRRRRDAFEHGSVTGDIYAFRDPSGRYREFELLFDRQGKTLTTVFIYPWHMTWEDCRDLWGDEVNTSQVANGKIFYSYRSRRLDVLVDQSGNVVNLGVY